MTLTIIISFLILITLVYGIITYNKLVGLRTVVEEAWSGIDIQLKKRYNLIPNLVETVKGYADHESDTFKEVTQARSQAREASSVKEQQAAENRLNQALINLNAVAEQYPDLKANTNYLDLQKQLTDIEQDIEKSRRYYNGTVRDKNILIDSFPSNMIASAFSFVKSDFFELDDLSHRELPKVNFD